MTTAAELTASRLEELLGADADDQLNHRCETLPADSLHLPGPDFVDRVLEGEQTITGTIDQVGERLRDYERAGVDRVMLQLLLHTDLEQIELIGELS